MKVYRTFGSWFETGGNVTVVNGNKRRLLDPRLDLANHSPTGLAWGYGGSGPSQLSLAILADATGNDRLAVRYYQTFKWEVIAKMDQGKPFELSKDAVVNWLKEKGAIQHE